MNPSTHLVHRDRLDRADEVTEPVGQITGHRTLPRLREGDGAPARDGSGNPDVLTATPRLEEGAGREVFGVVCVAGKPERMAVDPVQVPIEDRGEPNAVALDSRRSRRVLVRKRAHYSSCSHPANPAFAVIPP